jgi:hypothetical protein
MTAKGGDDGRRGGYDCKGWLEIFLLGDGALALNDWSL